MPKFPDNGMVGLKESSLDDRDLGTIGDDRSIKRDHEYIAQIDHSGDAAKAGLAMHPTKLLIFGNAKSGTPLMIASPTVAIDLPLKALVWEDAEGTVWLSYNTPAYLKQRHAIPDDLMQNIAGIVAICAEAVR